MVGEGCRSGGQLQGGYQQVALADGGNDVLARVPGPPAGAPLPCRGRHQAIGLIRQVHPSGSTEAEPVQYIGHELNTEFRTGIVEIGITRLFQGVVQVHPAMSLTFPAAVLTAAAGQHEPARTIDLLPGVETGF